jgi:hypothetical protein
MHDSDLLDIDAASNLMQGVTNGSLGGNELDVLEDAGITPELNNGDMNACMATESSSKNTNVHGADIAPEPSVATLLCSEVQAEEIEYCLCANNKRDVSISSSSATSTIRITHFVDLSFHFLSSLHLLINTHTRIPIITRNLPLWLIHPSKHVPTSLGTYMLESAATWRLQLAPSPKKSSTGW